MTDKKTPGNHDESRRKLLKTAAAGGTLGLKSIPAKWATPVVAAVALPAHGGGTLQCCGGYDSDSGPVSGTSTITSVPDGITQTNGTWQGTYNKGPAEYRTYCGPCGQGEIDFQFNFTAGGGSISKYFSVGFDCGASDWIDFSGSYNASSIGSMTYTFTGEKYTRFCTAKYGKTVKGDLEVPGALQRFRFGN